MFSLCRPWSWVCFFPNSVALVANFVIKDGLVAKICIIWNVLIKKKLRRGRQLPRPMQHVWDQPRTACTCMSSCEVPLYQSTPDFFCLSESYAGRLLWNMLFCRNSVKFRGYQQNKKFKQLVKFRTFFSSRNFDLQWLFWKMTCTHLRVIYRRTLQSWKIT